MSWVDWVECGFSTSLVFFSPFLVVAISMLCLLHPLQNEILLMINCLFLSLYKIFFISGFQRLTQIGVVIHSEDSEPCKRFFFRFEKSMDLVTRLECWSQHPKGCSKPVGLSVWDFLRLLMRRDRENNELNVQTHFKAFFLARLKKKN